MWPPEASSKQIGKRQAAGEPRDQGVRLEMIDGEERLAGRQRDPLAGHQADQHAADQAGSRGGGDAVEVARAHPGAAQRADDEAVDDFDMGARRDLRHDAAIGRMGGDLAHHFVGEDFAGAVGPQPHHRRRRFVAGGLDSQYAHRRFEVPKFGAREGVRAAGAVSIRLARDCPAHNERTAARRRPRRGASRRRWRGLDEKDRPHARARRRGAQRRAVARARLR